MNIISHETYMQRCLDLAKSGKGHVSPNPMVGSVIVHNHQIIGEGYHQKYGASHAEINAIQNVRDRSLLPHATLYVNLEPCSHQGQTPPCTDAIIREQIPRVVIGTADPNAKVAGRGVRKLREAGIEVIMDILKPSAQHLNKRFFCYHQKQRPYIILKWAQTRDGYIDYQRPKNTPKEPTWITKEIDRVLVHKWRSEEDAILVGTNTADKDNPKLNTRVWSGSSPLRLVIDRSLRLPGHLHLFDQSLPTVVFTEKKDQDLSHLSYVSLDFSVDILPEMLHYLYKQKIQSLIVEGGQQLLNSFIEQGLWDEARMFAGDRFFYQGIKAPEIKGQLLTKDELHHSSLYTFWNNRQYTS